MPEISVIMSVFNAKDYDVFYRSISSILNQSYSNFEFIICNDGSTNKQTALFLNKIKGIDSRIKIIGYKKNRGLAYSRNKCISIAQGKYIAFQDDDDISEPNRLLKEKEFLDTHLEYDFVGTNANIIDKSGKWGECKVPEKPVEKNFFWNSPFINPSMMFRKEALIRVNGFRVAQETKRVEDYDMFFRLYSNKMKGYNIQQNLINYRIEIDKEKYKKYRPMKDRISEAKIRYRGYKQLGLMPLGLIYSVKPILIGIIPHKIFYQIRKREYKG